jgi:acyl carrier protein
MKMTTVEKVGSLILQLKKKNITEADLKPDAHLVKDLKMDSLDLTELLVLAEEAFFVKIPTADIRKLSTIAICAEYIEKLQAKK